MKSELFCFKNKSCKTNSNYFKTIFKEDISNKFHKISQKMIGNYILIENFVPKLKPKISTRIPPPLFLNQNCQKILDPTNESLSEKKDSSFIDVKSELDSSSSDEEIIIICKNEGDNLKKDFSINDKSPKKYEDIKGENNLKENDNFINKDENINTINKRKCNVKLEVKKDIKNQRIQMYNLKDNLINVYKEENSSKNDIDTKNNCNIKIIDNKEENYDIKDCENILIINENGNNEYFKKNFSILDVLMSMKGN